MGVLRKNGFTMIETLAVVAILAILMTMSIFVFITQMAKGRDAKRKADLEKLKTVLEDYLNDNSCYPANLSFGQSFVPYLSRLPADPLNNTYYNYFYSFDFAADCKSWYKIYAKLENINDPLIAKVGCAGGCGPSNNYSYWVSSPNMGEVDQILPAENWWPEIPVAEPTPTPTIGGPTSTPTVVPTPTATPTAGGPTSTPAPTSTPGPTLTPTPTFAPEGDFYGCFSGECQPIAGPWVCPNINYQLPDCGGQCFDPDNECH